MKRESKNLVKFVKTFAFTRILHIGLATKWLWILSLTPIDKSRNHLVAKSIVFISQWKIERSRSYHPLVNREYNIKGRSCNTVILFGPASNRLIKTLQLRFRKSFDKPLRFSCARRCTRISGYLIINYLYLTKEVRDRNSFHSFQPLDSTRSCNCDYIKACRTVKSLVSAYHSTIRRSSAVTTFINCSNKRYIRR